MAQRAIRAFHVRRQLIVLWGLMVLRCAALGCVLLLVRDDILLANAVGGRHAFEWQQHDKKEDKKSDHD